MKFSIIIPVYNSEKYISRCLNSIVSQTFGNFEVVIINDGSVDNSAAICRKFLTDSRFKLFTKKNGGVSSARNFGLKKVNGEFILFLDSDDYIRFDTLEILSKASNDIDVLIFKRVLEHKGQSYNHNYPINQVFYFNNNLNEEWLLHFYSGELETFCTNKIFRNNFLKQNHIKFRNYSIFEDTIFMQECFLHYPRLLFVNENLYIYCKNKKSALNKYHLDRLNSFTKIYSNNLLLSKGNTHILEIINGSLLGGITNIIRQERFNSRKKRFLMYNVIYESYIFNVLLNKFNNNRTTNIYIELLVKQKFFLLDLFVLNSFFYLKLRSILKRIHYAKK